MDKPALEKLDAFNEDRSKEVAEEIAKRNEPVLNGIACPDCGTELFDTKPDEVTAGTPPGKEVHCGKKGCEFTGERIA